MAGDLDITERAVLQAQARASAARGERGRAQVIHRYGRLSILAEPPSSSTAARAAAPVESADLSDVERLGSGDAGVYLSRS
jgi:hypothetical protein